MTHPLDSIGGSWIIDPAAPFKQRPLYTSARLASTANVATLSGLQTIDGVSGAAGDIILLKDQTSGIQNGLYIMRSTAWERIWRLEPGMVVSVRKGTIGAASLWILVTDSFEVGVDALTFTQASGSGSPEVDVATTANIASLLGVQTIDDQAGAAGRKVLVKDQSTATDNGVYLMAAGAWTRISRPGFAVVKTGTVNGRHAFVQTSTDVYQKLYSRFK